VFSGEEWSNVAIILKPLTTIEGYESIELKESDITNYKVVGIFDRVIK
jgi:hypothetical protein